MKTTWSKRAQKEHRRKWVAALRSGQYKQAREQLFKPETGGMCCLGVACDISRLGEWDGPQYVTATGGHDMSLPLVVQSWLGLRDNEGGGLWGKAGDYESLSSKNDNGASFKQIANIIESEPEGLVAK